MSSKRSSNSSCVDLSILLKMMSLFEECKNVMVELSWLDSLFVFRSIEFCPKILCSLILFESCFGKELSGNSEVSLNGKVNLMVTSSSVGPLFFSFFSCSHVSHVV